MNTDIEKHGGTVRTAGSSENGYEKSTPPYGFQDETGAVAGESFEVGDSLYARLQRLAGRFNVEQRGIERVPENERTDKGFRALLNVSTMWLSANLVVSSFALGLLANGVFYLGVADAMLVILFFNLLGIMPVCFFSVFGPTFGLRQMVLSRFWFGWWGVKLSMREPDTDREIANANRMQQSPFSTFSHASDGPPSTLSSAPSSSTLSTTMFLVGPAS